MFLNMENKYSHTYFFQYKFCQYIIYMIHSILIIGGDAYGEHISKDFR